MKLLDFNSKASKSLNVQQSKNRLNKAHQILDNTVHELKDNHRRHQTHGKENIKFCQEEHKMWRQATAIRPPDKLETPTFSKGEACRAPTNQKAASHTKNNQVESTFPFVLSKVSALRRYLTLAQAQS